MLCLKLVGVYFVLSVRTSFKSNKFENSTKCFFHFRISWDIGATGGRGPVVLGHRLHFFIIALALNFIIFLTENDLSNSTQFASPFRTIAKSAVFSSKSPNLY